MDAYNSNKDAEIYGYCIGENIEFRVCPPVLVNICTGRSIRLRPTMARLLGYFLQHARDKLISDSRIVSDVFEQYGLKCSQQRLWQAVRALKEVLSKCGFKREFIMRIRNSGFTLSDERVVTLFLRDPFDNQEG
ncbi:TPA: transcriptional regulator [Klebsiella oxytoca]|uniref:winged helix-turn-helix domain-containing protein n=1 Tax=Klebsiella oxytoca TaxID=571 RepID=UPI00115B2630|nr:hypothetical protein [Klebsiella oxytoca]HBV8970899.1 hypothetical protein [Klebsiella oxytoca]